MDRSKKNMRAYEFTLVIFIVLQACTGQQQPADKGANAKTKETYEFMIGLPKQGKYLSGQFAGVSGKDFSLNQVNSIVHLTGQYPSIIACDYSNGWCEAITPKKLLN